MSTSMSVSSSSSSSGRGTSRYDWVSGLKALVSAAERADPLIGQNTHCDTHSAGPTLAGWLSYKLPNTSGLARTPPY